MIYSNDNITALYHIVMWNVIKYFIDMLLEITDFSYITDFRQIPKIWSDKFLSDRIEKGIEPGLKTRKKIDLRSFVECLANLLFFSRF